MSGISSIKGASESTNIKTKIYRILVILILSGRSSLYVISPKTFKILKSFSLVKSNLLLSLVVLINIIFVFSIFYKKYALFSSLRVSPQIFFLLVNFFIILLKNIKSYCSSVYNSQISSIIITIYYTNSSHSFISSETSALNPLFIKNGVLLVMLYLEVLYAIIPMGSSLTQLIYQQSQKHVKYCFSV